VIGSQFDQLPAGDGLRVIPLSRRGETGMSFAVAQNDEEERAVRAKADEDDLIHGSPMFFPKE
jgi:hypothetical protein